MSCDTYPCRVFALASSFSQRLTAFIIYNHRGVMDACLEFARMHQFQFRHFEQDVMNFMLIDKKWDLLPFRYNAQGLGTYAIDKIHGPGLNPMAKHPMLYLQVSELRVIRETINDRHIRHLGMIIAIVRS